MTEDRTARRPALRALLPAAPKAWGVLRGGYSWADVPADLAAGVTVGVIALPLGMAFAIASGLPPERGLFTAIVAGFLISALGGSRFQIGGPTGAFVVIVAGIVAQHGYTGLQVATLMAAGLLLLMGLFRFGAMLKYIPYPVTTGFTSGIALIIFSSQIKDLLGLQVGTVPADFVARWGTYLAHLHTAQPAAVAVSIGSLAVIVYFRRVHPRIPGPIVAVVLASLAVWALDLPVETIGSRFGGIPRGLPAPAVPAWTFEQFRLLAPEAITIALLAGIESLLCAVVADGMTGDRHNANTELVAQGLANLGSVLFGGMPATGALARTATNIRAGARSPLAGIVHAATLLALTLGLAPLASRVPLPALAAILVMVAWNMSELDHFRSMFRAPKSDAAVMTATFGLTVLVDLSVAVQVGVVLAALLFMRRMAEVTQVEDVRREATDQAPEAVPANGSPHTALPAGVEVYEITGPFFFGAADRLWDVLPNLEAPPRVVVLRLRAVPAIDATGLHALDEFHAKCVRAGTALVLSGLRPQPAQALRKTGLAARIGPANLLADWPAAVQRATVLAAGAAGHTVPPLAAAGSGRP